MRFVKLIWISGIGILIFLAGIVYGTITVGIPYQDPTEAQQANERLHLSITDWIMFTGLTVFVIGLLYVPVKIIAKRKNREGLK